MKKILIVWTFVAVFLISGLTFIGLNIKKQNAPYVKFEKELENAAMALIGEKPTYLNSSNKITIEDLKNNNYEINMYVNNDTCTDGYVIVQNNRGIYKYTGYIKCNKYTSHGYKD